jgi:hypothetical protein
MHRFTMAAAAIAAIAFSTALAGDAQARLFGGSSGGYGSSGGGGSHGGSHGGLFSRHRGGGDCGCYADHGSSGGNGSHGGRGSNGGNGGYDSPDHNNDSNHDQGYNTDEQAPEMQHDGDATKSTDDKNI